MITPRTTQVPPAFRGNLAGPAIAATYGFTISGSGTLANISTHHKGFTRPARRISAGACLLLSTLLFSLTVPFMAWAEKPKAQADHASTMLHSVVYEAPKREGDNQDYIQHGKGLLAIVIDDIGHNLPQLRAFLELPSIINYAVLPDVRQAPLAATMIRDEGMEFIIHLPMQPMDYPSKNPGKYPLLLRHGLRETRMRMEEYMARLPGFVGASNHMGSAYSYDKARMRVVQGVLQEQGKFFLNSKTSPATTPRDIARHQGYRYLERDVFLDHNPSVKSVRRQLRRAVAIAREKGSAIAIGHPYDSTLEVLRADLNGLMESGIVMVPLSSLLHR